MHRNKSKANRLTDLEEVLAGHSLRQLCRSSVCMRSAKLFDFHSPRLLTLWIDRLTNEKTSERSIIRDRSFITGNSGVTLDTYSSTPRFRNAPPNSCERSIFLIPKISWNRSAESETSRERICKMCCCLINLHDFDSSTPSRN